MGRLLRFGRHFANSELQYLLSLFAQQLNLHGRAHWGVGYRTLEIQRRLDNGAIELRNHIASDNASPVRGLIV